jgi:hypothetical protein
MYPCLYIYIYIYIGFLSLFPLKYNGTEHDHERVCNTAYTLIVLPSGAAPSERGIGQSSSELTPSALKANKL